MLNYPRRDLEVEHVVLNVLAGRTRGADPPYDSDGGCDVQDRQKIIRSRDDSYVRFGCLAIVCSSRLL